MTTLFGTNRNNTLIVEADDLRGLAGNDTYIVTNNLANDPANANRVVVIIDTEGDNRLQLADGLQISRVDFLGGNAIQVTLTNNLRIQLVAADRFTFDIGGNSAAGDALGLIGRTYAQLADAFSVTLNNGAGSTGSPVTIQPGANPVGPSAPPPPPPPVLSIAPLATPVAEGNSGSTAFTYTVNRTGDTSGATTVNYAVTGSGANPVNASDFVGGTLPTGMVSFTAGQTSQMVTVNVAGDTMVEGNETFTISLSGPTGATLGTANATSTIVNDDAAPPPPPTNTSTPTADERMGVVLAQINDPLFSAQWYLHNTGQRYTGGQTPPSQLLDLNILPIWARGIIGTGVRIAVNDDGIDLDHADLQANLLKDLTFNAQTNRVGADAYTAGVNNYAPGNGANSHGTVVGSIAAMTGRNGTGMIGIAHDARLVSTLTSSLEEQGKPKLQLKPTFDYLLANNVDVAINSFGLDPAFSDHYYIAPGTDPANYTIDQQTITSITAAATQGRSGRGMVIEVSAGNEATNKADAGLTGFSNSRFIITVGAVTELGEKTEYTSPGASVLLSAFGGVGTANAADNSGFGIASADISGAGGDNKTADSTGDYAFQNQGTSYSGPMVGATAALMLQANPSLGFRDVSIILALTARGVGTTNNYTTTNSTAWNLGGMHFSRDVGFGLLDATAAVQLAESWTLPAGTAANWVSAQGASANAAAAVPDNDPNGLTVTAMVNQNVLIERMEFDLKLNATTPSQLRAEITSPNGTTIVLFDEPLSKEKDKANDPNTPDTAWPDVFTIGSTAFLGETSQGTWTLKLIDKVTGTVASYDSLTVRAWGSAITADSQYVFTREFAGQRTLTDTMGIDLVNAAALQTAVTINLNEGQTSTVAGGTFTIAAGSVIENANGGSGADTLVGNANGNLLRGNLGADMLTGGGGNDVFFYHQALDSTATASDQITDFTMGDLINLLGLDANIGTSGNQDFVFRGESALMANSLSYAREGGNTVLSADLDGNTTTTEFRVILLGNITLTANDFIGVVAA